MEFVTTVYGTVILMLLIFAVIYICALRNKLKEALESLDYAKATCSDKDRQILILQHELKIQKLELTKD